MILTSYLYVCVCYKMNNGILNKLAPVSIVTLWIQVVMTNCCWEQWTVVEHGPRCTAGSVRVAAATRTEPAVHNHLYPQCNNTDWS
jgi:hypothetical protein